MTDAPKRLRGVARSAAEAEDARKPRRRVPVPKLLLLGLPLNLLAITGGCWMFINAFVILDETAPLAVIALSSVNLVVLVLLIRRILNTRAVEEQRRYIRVDLELDAELDGEACRLTEISLGGCQVELGTKSGIQVGQEVQIQFRMTGQTFELNSVVRGIGVTHNRKQLLRLTFQAGQNAYIERLAMDLLRDDGAWAA